MVLFQKLGTAFTNVIGNFVQKHLSGIFLASMGIMLATLLLTLVLLSPCIGPTASTQTVISSPFEIDVFEERFNRTAIQSPAQETALMTNSTQVDIYHLIVANPGIDLVTIKKRLGLKNGTADYNLYALQKRGIIRSVKVGRSKRYYETDLKASGLNHLQEEIIVLIRSHPGMTQTEIANRLGKSRQVVNYNLRDLIRTGKIELVRSGNRTYCFTDLEE
jgi:DNA-binding MarR family transcriptional regulator